MAVDCFIIRVRRQTCGRSATLEYISTYHVQASRRVSVHAFVLRASLVIRFSEAVGFAPRDQTQVKTLYWQELVPFEATMALKKALLDKNYVVGF